MGEVVNFAMTTWLKNAKIVCREIKSFYEQENIEVEVRSFRTMGNMRYKEYALTGFSVRKGFG